MRRKNTAEAFEILLRMAEDRRKKAQAEEERPGKPEAVKNAGKADPLGPVGIVASERTGAPGGDGLPRPRLRPAPGEPLLAPPRQLASPKTPGLARSTRARRGSRWIVEAPQGDDSLAGGPKWGRALERWRSERPVRYRRPAAERTEREEPSRAGRGRDGRERLVESEDLEARRALLGPFLEEESGDQEMEMTAGIDIPEEKASSHWVREEEPPLLSRASVDPVLLQQSAGDGPRESVEIHCLEAREVPPADHRVSARAGETTRGDGRGGGETPGRKGPENSPRAGRRRRKQRSGSRVERGGRGSPESGPGPEKAAGDREPHAREASPEPEAAATGTGSPKPVHEVESPPREPEPGRTPAEPPVLVMKTPVRPSRGGRVWTRVLDWTVGTTLGRLLEKRVEVRVSTFVAWGMVGVVVALLLLAQGTSSPGPAGAWNPPPGPAVDAGDPTPEDPGGEEHPGEFPLKSPRKPLVIWSPDSDPHGSSGGMLRQSVVEDPDLRNVRRKEPEQPGPEESLESPGGGSDDGGKPPGAESEPDTDSAPYLYRIQVRSRESQEGAEEIVNYMRELGFRDHFIEAEPHSPGRYKVFVGKFFDKDLADRELLRLKAAARRVPYRGRQGWFQDSLVKRRDRDGISSSE